MDKLTFISFLILLSLLNYIWIHHTIKEFVHRFLRQARLTNLHRFIELHPSWIRMNEFHMFKKIAFLLESVNSKMKIKVFIQTSILLFIIGILIGSFLFGNLKGFIIFGMIFGALPYIILRIHLISFQMKSRIELLPAVEMFYQVYVLMGQKNLRITLKMLIEENRLSIIMKPILEQLYRNLSTQRDVEESLHLFYLCMGHKWSEYLKNILYMGMTEGGDISSNLKELISDMRKAQRADQVERNRLLEIRIANFTPILFLIIFLMINFQLNYDNAIYYYFVDSGGKGMLLDALLLIFLSFMMGIYLSIKRM